VVLGFELRASNYKNNKMTTKATTFNISAVGYMGILSEIR
jgi:hypothetical protein